jgi:YD repeat-containing protein
MHTCGWGRDNILYDCDLAGDLTSWTHAAGFTITNAIDAAQQITGITSSLNDSTHPPVLAQNITYTPFGALASLQNGCAGSGCTQVQETYDYNKRLQPVRMQLGTASNNSANRCLVYNCCAGVANPTSCVIPSQAR